MKPLREANRRRFLKLTLLLLATTAVAFAVDAPVYSFVHTHWNHETRPIPDVLKLPHRILRSAENWGENFFIIGIAFTMWQLDKSRRSRVLALVVAAIVSAVAVEGIKRLSGRERPDQCAGQSVFHGPAKGYDGGDFQSFPSGHTAAAASYSGSLSVFYPPLRPVVIPLAIACGGSRIWKERHFFSDCWVGGVLGFLTAFCLPRSMRWQRLAESFDRRFSHVARHDSQSNLPRIAA